MSSNFKKSKSELIAIYRLEFYKKQKNWKLSHEKNKNSEPSATKVVFNKTYNIDSAEPQVEPPAALNYAFFDESDYESSTEQPKSPEPQAGLSQDLALQELKPHEHVVDADDNWIAPIESHQQRNYIEPLKEYESEWSPGSVEPVPSTVPSDHWDGQDIPTDNDIHDHHLQDIGEIPPWPAPEPYGECEPCSVRHWERLAREYALAGDTWGDEQAMDGGWCGAWGAAGEGAGEGEASVVREARRVVEHAKHFLRNMDSTHFEWDPSLWADLSNDSASSFVHGARVAPHSSEVELKDNSSSSSMDAWQLALMSREELSSKVSRRTTSIKKLLRELYTREKLMQVYPYKRPANVSHELPTRDIGLSLPQPPLQSPQLPLPSPQLPLQSPQLPLQSPQDQFYQFPPQLSFPIDPFVAGSFMHSEDPVGRGRGRRLIGIGMGRPYRL